TRAMKAQNQNQFIVCGEAPDVDKAKQIDKSYLQKGDLEIHKIIQGGKGLEVRFTWKNVTYNVEAPLFGIHHGHNLAMAFVAAFELGVSSKDIQAALPSLPQIEHRLEVRKQSGGLTIIDDAYNSNPLGFQAALGLLSQIGTGRKILITPGMVELGKIHDEAHKSIGAYAGQVCDVAIVVKGKRIPTFISAFKETGASKQLHEVESFDEAQKWIAKNKQDGDVVLIENDLPDIYERVPKI
ncbi:MAG TPA: cyanophycin synthetase, partial [Alphaproteobacteria bacterium]|nr:cyanophycin synthetase [Alphaproteobacteria bacterium]